MNDAVTVTVAHRFQQLTHVVTNNHITVHIAQQYKLHKCVLF